MQGILERGISWAQTSGLGAVLNLLYAILIFAIGLLLARIAVRSLRPLFDRSRIGQDALLKKFFLRVISGAIVIVATVSALAQIGVQVTPIIASLGLTGVIIGFAFKDTLSNLAAGLLILIYRPFYAGHTVDIGGTLGTVDELTIVNTQLITPDGLRVYLPNSKVWESKIINYSTIKHRRLELSISVKYEQDFDRVRQAIQEILDSDGRILKDPPPSVQIAELGLANINARILAWTSLSDFGSVRDEIYNRVRIVLQREGAV